MYDIILSFILAFFISYWAIPIIINVAEVKHLYDVPGERSAHTKITPRLGGIGVFMGLFLSITFWAPYKLFANLQYVLCALIIIFLIGAKDDIDPISPKKKFFGEIFASLILMSRANIYLTNMHGIFGVYEMPLVVGLALTLFTFLLIINAVNLIDGINGLAGSVSIVICTTFGYWFYLADRIELAILAAATIGALVGFLRYNYAGNIFMGDAGALILGLLISILAIEFIQMNLHTKNEHFIHAAPIVAIGVLVIPLFDTLRVFTLRVLKGKSPFYPDKTHIHHLLLECKIKHLPATFILVGVNLLFVFLAFYFSFLHPLVLLGLLLGVALTLTSILVFSARQYRKRVPEKAPANML